jgi:Tfp pilus assembly protein PilF
MKRLIFLLLALLALAGCEKLSGERASSETHEALDTLRQSDPAGAVIKLKQQLEITPRDDIVWTMLGHAYEDLDQDGEAEGAYRKALEINPRRFDAITGMGILSRKKGEYDEAMAHYEKALNIDPTYAPTYSSMTIIALKQGKDAKALEYAKKGYDLKKTDPVIVANLAVAYHYNGMLKLRDEMTEEAKKLGYKKSDQLHKIYTGEMTLRD